MGNLFWTVAVILLFTLGDRASTVLAQKSQSGVSQQSDLTPEKSEVSANATVVVTTQLDQAENGEYSDEKNEEAEKQSGEITIEINGKKHSFSLGDETEQLNRTFKKVIRDGENSIAIIAGSVNGSGLDAESIQKMIKDASEGLPDSGELAEIVRDLPGNLSEEIEKNIKSGTIINFNMKKRIKKDIYMVTHEGVAIVTQYADGGALGGHAIAQGSCDFWNVQKSSGENKYYDDVRVRLVTSTTWLKLEKYQIEDESYGVLLTPEMDPSLKIKLIESVNKDEGIYWSEKDQENIVYYSHWDKAPISEICWRVICKLEGENQFYSNRRYFEEIEDHLNFLDRYIPVTKN